MVIGKYISIITLNVNGLNAPTKDIDWLNGYKNKAHIYAVYKTPFQTYGDIQTESEGMENDIRCKWKSEESCSSNSHIR